MSYKPGDKVEVVTKDSSVSGMIMPNENDSTLFVKLPNGYNIGVDKKKIQSIKVIEPFKDTKKESAHELKVDKKLPTIAILHTGGTIASQVDYRTGAVISRFTPEDLLKSVPEIKDIANIKTEKLFQMFSEDMEPVHWSQLAGEVRKQIEQGVDGVIITHGTDTLSYSSAALSFMLQDLPIPVIYVAAQRSSDRASSDAASNLIAACKFIAQSDFAGIGVCMHKNEDDGWCYIHSGVNVRKMHTSRRDTFRSLNVKPYAEIEYSSGKINYLRDYPKKDKNKKLIFKGNAVGGNVVILKVRPGFNYKELELYKDYAGIILESTGLGNAPVNELDEKTKDHPKLINTIKKMSKDSIIAITSQAMYGPVNMHVYSSGRDLLSAGAIPANMLTETAYAKLIWAIGNLDMKLEDIKKVMQTNICGEIVERIEKDTFLI